MKIEIDFEWDTDEGTLEIFNDYHAVSVRLSDPFEVKTWQEFFQSMGMDVNIYIDGAEEPTNV